MKRIIGCLVFGLVVAVAVAGVGSWEAREAQALTESQLVTILEAAGVERSVINAVVAAMNFPSATVTEQFTRDLTLGSVGSDVQRLQRWLNQNGHPLATSGAGSPGLETTYFGERTRAAVASYQRAEGITPTAGYFGPITRASINRKISEAAVRPDPTVPVEDKVTASLSASRRTIERGEATVLTWGSEHAVSCEGSGFDTDDDTAGEVEVSPEENTTYTVTCVDRDGKTAKTSVSITVTEPAEPGLQGDEGYLEVTDMSVSSEQIDLGDRTTVYEFEVEAIDSDLSIGRMDLRFTRHRPWLYFDEVHLLLDGVEIASLAGISGNFHEIGNEWRARFTGLDQVIREGDTVEFAVEVSTPRSLAGARDQDRVGIYLPRDGIRAIDGAGFLQHAPDSDLRVTLISFDERFGEGDLSLLISDNSPESKSYVVDETSRTFDQLLVEVDARASSASDVKVNDVILNLDAGTNSVSDIIYRAHLYMDGSRVRTVAPGSDRIKFDDVNRVVRAGRTSEFKIEVDFRRASGYSTPAEFTVQDLVFEVEDKDFVSFSESVFLDETHELIEEGLVASVVRVSANRIEIGNDIEGEYVFEFQLKAIGDTFFVSRNTATSTSYSLDGEGAGATNIHLSQLTSNALETGAGNFRIRDGETRRFTLTKEVERTVSGRGAVEMTLESLHYSDVDDAVMDKTLTLGGRDWRTSQISLRRQ